MSMRAKNTKKKIITTLDEITEHLDSIAEHMAWLIKPDTRFRVGQRVEWSRKGRRLSMHRRKVAQRGVVKAIGGGFTLTVKLDGQKQERSYHHAFFNPVSGPKLF